MRTLTRHFAAACALGCLLAACGSGHEGNPVASSAAPVVKKKVVNPADPLARILVSAVASTKAGTAPIPVQVKFAIQAHPQANQPADVDIVMVPDSATLDRLFGKVQGEEGLEVVSGAELPDTQKPADSVPIHHVLKVLAKNDGIYELTVTVSVDTAGVDSTQTYTIPVIAGKGMPDLPASGAPLAAAPPAPVTPVAPAPGH